MKIILGESANLALEAMHKILEFHFKKQFSFLEVKLTSTDLKRKVATDENRTLFIVCTIWDGEHGSERCFGRVEIIKTPEGWKLQNAGFLLKPEESTTWINFSWEHWHSNRFDEPIPYS